MRKWTVEGADKQTGQMRVVSIDALTADEAEQAAAARGLLVANVHESTVGDVDVRAAMRGDRARPAAPPYTEIVAGQRAIDGLATLVRVLALLSFLIAAISLVVTLIAAHQSEQPAGALVVGIGWSLVPAAYGVLMLVAAVLLRLVGSLSLAVRDIARNSFERMR